MTSESCIPVDLLAGAAESPKGSPLRAHLDDCPRCQAQWLALRAFVAPQPLPPQARASEADAELDRFIDELGAEVRPAPDGAIAPFPTPWWVRWISPGPRLVLAASMLAVVAVGAWLLQRPVTERALTRGGPMGTSDSGSVITSEPTVVADGWLLQWSAVDEATGYEVILLGSDLTERARFNARSATHMTLAASRIPKGLDPEQGLAWQVEAHRGADIVARSSVAELPRR
ncbi:MAG: hypothetical protein ABIU54_13710 [Candidatus Eisenbacteria bacterium]